MRSLRKQFSRADIAFKWFLSDNSAIALFAFRLTYPGKECILPAKDLRKHWGILSSCVSEIHHLLAATLSFATPPLGNNSHAVLWIIQCLPHWLILCSVSKVEKTARFKMMSTVIGHRFSRVSNQSSYETHFITASLFFSDPETFYSMPTCAIFAQLLIF